MVGRARCRSAQVLVRWQAVRKVELRTFVSQHSSSNITWSFIHSTSRSSCIKSTYAVWLAQHVQRRLAPWCMKGDALVLELKPPPTMASHNRRRLSSADCCEFWQRWWILTWWAGAELTSTCQKKIKSAKLTIGGQQPVSLSKQPNNGAFRADLNFALYDVVQILNFSC